MKNERTSDSDYLVRNVNVTRDDDIDEEEQKQQQPRDIPSLIPLPSRTVAVVGTSRQIASDKTAQVNNVLWIGLLYVIRMHSS